MQELQRHHHARHRKSAVKIEFEYFWTRLLYDLLRAMPLHCACCCARFFGTLSYYLDSLHRTRTVKHILHAHMAANHSEASRMGRRVFQHFSLLLMEIFKKDQYFDISKVHLTGDEETIRRCFAHDGKAAEQNFILITAHYGNWELAGGAIGLLAGHHLVSLMRPFSNPKIGELILRSRRTPEHELLSKNGGLRGVLRALRDHKNVAILIDQHAAQKEGVEGTFFGQPCRTHVSPALLHLKTGIPILAEVTRRLPGDDFSFEIEVAPLIRYQPTGDMEHDVAALTQQCTDVLEKLIRKDPEQWLWAHRRWLNIDRTEKKSVKKAEKN